MQERKPERRRWRLWLVAFPVVLVALLMTAALSLILIPRTTAEASIIADLWLICFVLLPLVICLAPLYLLLAAAFIGVGNLINVTERQLVRAKSLTEVARERTTTTADDLNRRSIGISARFAFLDRIFNQDNAKHE